MSEEPKKSRHLTAETRVKIGNANRGHKHTPEARAKMAEAAYAAGRNPETWEKRSAAQKKRWADPETRARLLGREVTAATRLKQRNSHLGQKASPEKLAKMSAIMKQRNAKPEVRARQAAKMRGRKHTEETKAKMREAKLGHEVTPETRAKISRANLGRRWSLLPVVRANRSAAMVRRLEQHKDGFGTSKLEVVVANELDNLKVAYERQRAWRDIKGRITFVVDFWLTEAQVALEVNGTYFHADPRLQWPTLGLIQQKCLTRDACKKEYLDTLDIQIVTIWELDILKDSRQAVEQALYAAQMIERRSFPGALSDDE